MEKMFYMQLNVLRERSEKAPWKRGAPIPREIFSANAVVKIGEYPWFVGQLTWLKIQREWKCVHWGNM